jgi:tRNA nucleotidyltransferase (CCA-adding enzyme)
LEVITTHVNSDFDALGSMVAAKKLYPGALLSFPGSQEKSLRNFFLASSIYAAGFESAKRIDLSKITRLIIVDVNDPGRIGKFAELLGKEGVEIHLYDHHPEGSEVIRADFGKAEMVGATTTLLVELLMEKKIPVEPAEATVMLLGIFEDTGKLTFSATTPRDFYAAGKLLEMGADLSAVTGFLEPEMTAEEVALLDDLLKSRVTRAFNGVRVTTAKASVSHYLGDVAALAHKICEIENIDVLIMSVSMEGRVILVARSRLPEADVSLIAQHFGGGGHREAASAAIRDLTPIQVEEQLEKILPFFVKPKITARDILSSPVKTVDARDTLEEVRAALNRYHVNAMPVLKEGRIAGIITRMVVERAIGHGLSGASAEEYMTSEFSTVSPDTGFDTLRALIVDKRLRFLPVVEGENLIGAITRTDILEVLTRDERMEPLSPPKSSNVRSAKRAMEDLLSPDVLGKLKALGELAASEGMQAYLVGGLVRDLLLHRKNLDVDIVVEGDAIALAKKAAALWGAKVREHRPFSTAKMTFKDGFSIDFATARTEYYKRPAALPTVEESSLKLDLYRRDFTINTIAVRLEPSRFGDVIDFFGGLRDLKEGTVRILHNLSFVDDPTRILRALRFSERFGFRLGTQTEKLLKNAVSGGFLARSRGRRLFREWRSILEEVEPEKALNALDKYGCLQSFHPKIALNDKTRQKLSAVEEVVSWFSLLFLERKVEAWKLIFLALLEALDDAELEGFLKEFGIENAEGEELRRVRKEGNALLLALRTSKTGDSIPDSRIYGICSAYGDLALLWAMAKTRDESKRKALSRYYTRLVSAKTLLGGKDLRKMGIPPGPEYKILLSELLGARLDGSITTKEDEIAWVKKRLASIS